MLTIPGSADAIGSTPASCSASTCEYRSSIDASASPPRTVGWSSARGCTARTSVHASWYGTGSWRAGPPTFGSSLWLCTMAAPRSRHSSAHSAISDGDRGTAGFTDLVVLPLIAASMMTGARPELAMARAYDAALRRAARHLARPPVVGLPGRRAHDL